MPSFDDLDTSNVAESDRYAEQRSEIEAFFVPQNRIDESVKIDEAPCGGYELRTYTYSTGPHTWKYSRGLVTRRSDGTVVADIKRNHGHFWHAWVNHPNGNTYLLCGEDYQGYSVINLTAGRTCVYFPAAGFDGGGFCWVAAHPSPDRTVLAVDGCYWAVPGELVFLDVREPEALPFPELARFGELVEYEGWVDGETFVLTRDELVRKHDGVTYESLPRTEQNTLDSDSSLMDYRREVVSYKRPLI